MRPGSRGGQSRATWKLTLTPRDAEPTRTPCVTKTLGESQPHTARVGGPVVAGELIGGGTGTVHGGDTGRKVPEPRSDRAMSHESGTGRCGFRMGLE